MFVLIQVGDMVCMLIVTGTETGRVGIAARWVKR